MQAVQTPAAPIRRVLFFRRIGWRITLSLLLVSLLPLAIITAIGLIQAQAQYRTQVHNQLESIAILKRSQLERWVEEGQQEVALLAASEDVIRAARTGSTTDSLSAALERSADIQRLVNTLFLYSLEGQIIAASDPILVGRVVTRQPYFEPSLADAYLQPPYFDISTGELSVIATAPVYDGGALVGVMGLSYSTDELSEIMLERSGLGESGESYLVSQDNNYFLTPSRFEGYPQNRSYNSDGISAALAGRSGRGEYLDYRSPSVPVFGNYTWIPELRSAMLVEIDTTEVLATFDLLRRQILGIGIVVTILVILLGLFIGRSVAIPLNKLTRGAEALARGKYNERVVTNSKDELGVLGDAFNEMAEAIQSRTTQLAAARDEALAAQRIARENSRLKSEFLATMSHELRTPLNAIEGFTSIMLSGMGIELSPQAEDMVRRVGSNSKRLLQLVNDFLDLSRIEAGRMDIVPSPLSPAKLVRKWQSQTSVLGEGKGLEFEVNIDPTLPEMIMADEDALSKVVVNLLSNAFKFTHKGKVTLDLRADNDWWEISVSDTGIGIPAHAREYIFEEFRQVDGSSKRLYGGTGLGLALVQKLTREMGGIVSLQSEVGVGSTFTVKLPLEAAVMKETA